MPDYSQYLYRSCGKSELAQNMVQTLGYGKLIAESTLHKHGRACARQSCNSKRVNHNLGKFAIIPLAQAMPDVEPRKQRAQRRGCP
jgi:hypothetical protein